MTIRDLVPWKRNAVQRHREEHPFSSFTGEMNRFFDDFFGGFDLSPFGRRAFEFSPPLDVSENDTEITVKAELPGMDEDDIEVAVDSNSLTLKGEKKGEKEDKNRGYYHAERSYGFFSRTVSLPQEIDRDRVSARFNKGVLTVKLPKTEAAVSRKIQIKAQ